MKNYYPLYQLASVGCIIISNIMRLSDAQDSHQDFLDAHNAARDEVGVEPLAWDNTVAAYAQHYANKRIHDCQLVHSGGPYGENLAWGIPDLSAVDASKMWVIEKPNYDYDSNSCVAGQMCLHYTQVVWRNSRLIGCGKAKCNNGATFIVCNYDPPGNFIGETPY